MFKFFKKGSETGSSCCNIQIEEVKEEACCSTEENQECCLTKE